MPAPQGTSGNNGDVIGYTYSDAINPTLSHSALYVYDSLNRLTCAQATGSSTYNLTFNYDRFGNMSCVTNAQTNGPCPNWTFNAATNRISTPGWSYDVAGEVTSDAIHADQWDAEGRMKSVDNVNQTLPCPSYAAACMTFNALGQRVEMQLPSAGGWRYEYLYDPWGHEHGSYDGAGNTWGERNILLGQRQIAVYYGGYTRLLHPNHLGSTLQVSYGTGANAQDQLYYPWGQQWQLAGTGEDGHFAGFEQGESLGFNPTLFRKYNSTHGRWLSPDPGGLKVVHLDDPQTWNMYAYVRNNPTTLTDPSGLDGLDWLKQCFIALDVPLWLLPKKDETPPPRLPPATAPKQTVAELKTDVTKRTTTFLWTSTGTSEVITVQIATRVDVDKRADPGAGDPYRTDDIVGVSNRHAGERAYGPAGAFIDTGDPRRRQIHGGGGHGVDDPLAPRQGWSKTFGCTRGQNEDVINLGDAISSFQEDDPQVPIPYIRE